MLTWYSSFPSPSVRSASSQNAASMGWPSLPSKPSGNGAGSNSFSFSLTDWNCTKPLSENWECSYIKKLLTFKIWTEVSLTVSSHCVSHKSYIWYISLLILDILPSSPINAIKTWTVNCACLQTVAHIFCPWMESLQEEWCMENFHLPLSLETQHHLLPLQMDTGHFLWKYIQNAPHGVKVWMVSMGN